MKEKLMNSIMAVFVDFAEEMFHEELLLRDIPGWDSMSMVNFQLDIESRFAIHLPEDIFSNSTQVRDILAYLQEHAS